MGEGESSSFAVSDDGLGFDPETVAAGSGLRNIRERVGELGGTMRIVSRPGGGSAVQGSIPLLV